MQQHNKHKVAKKSPVGVLRGGEGKSKSRAEVEAGKPLSNSGLLNTVEDLSYGNDVMSLTMKT